MPTKEEKKFVAALVGVFVATLIEVLLIDRGGRAELIAVIWWCSGFLAGFIAASVRLPNQSSTQKATWIAVTYVAGPIGLLAMPVRIREARKAA